MITPEHPLPITRQCRLLDLARSSFYYRPKPLSARDLELMGAIDESTQYPFYGSRRIMHELRGRGYRVGQGHVSRLMRKMGIRAIWRRPCTTIPHPDTRSTPTCSETWISPAQARSGART